MLIVVVTATRFHIMHATGRTSKLVVGCLGKVMPDVRHVRAKAKHHGL